MKNVHILRREKNCLQHVYGPIFTNAPWSTMTFPIYQNVDRLNCVVLSSCVKYFVLFGNDLKGYSSRSKLRFSCVIILCNFCQFLPIFPLQNFSNDCIFLWWNFESVRLHVGFKCTIMQSVVNVFSCLVALNSVFSFGIHVFVVAYQFFLLLFANYVTYIFRF